MNEKSFFSQIVILNEVTGVRYHFACGRWFGRDVDDGGLERILVPTVMGDEEEGPAAMQQPQVLKPLTILVSREYATAFGHLFCFLCRAPWA